MKKILFFLITALMFVSCSELESSLTSDSGNESGQKFGSLSIVNEKIAESAGGEDSGDFVPAQSPQRARALKLDEISSMSITVMGAGMSDITKDKIKIENGKGSDKVEGIPIGINRIVKVTGGKTFNDVFNKIAGLDMYAVCDIKEGDNSVSVNWGSTALGMVYAKMLENLQKQAPDADEKKAEDLLEEISTDYVNKFIPLGVHALLMNTDEIAKDVITYYKSGEERTIQPNKYKIEAGSVKIKSSSSMTDIRLQVGDPCSEYQDGLGTENVISNVAPGTWTVYILDTDKKKILFHQDVTVASGKQTELTVQIKVLTPCLQNQDGTAYSKNGILEGEKETVYLRLPQIEGEDPIQDVSIYYTIGDNGTEPEDPVNGASATNKLYDDTKGIEIYPDQWLKARAFKNGLKPSDVLSEYKKFKKYGKLGLPVLRQRAYGYNSIQLEWDKVKGTEDDGQVKDAKEIYSFIMYYTDDDSKTPINLDASGKDKGVIDGNGTPFTWTIENVLGAEDVTKAGKDITVEITAKKTFDGEELTTTSDFHTHLVGPAAVNTRKGTNSYQTDTISIKWEETPGANAYAVFRKKYINMTASSFTNDVNEYCVIYYVTKDASGYKVSAKGVNDSVITDNLVTATVAGIKDGITTIELLDKCGEIAGQAQNGGGQAQNDGGIAGSSATSNYEKKQNEMAIGFPYAYFVVPLINESDKNYLSFTPNLRSVGITVGNGTVTHTYDSTDQLVNTAMKGYGVEVTADKAKMDKEIYVNWRIPFAFLDTTENPYLSKEKPHIYRRRFNMNKGKNPATTSVTPGEWVEIKDFRMEDYANVANKKQIKDVLIDENGQVADGIDECAAYEYAVSYRDAVSDNISASYIDYLKTNLDDNNRYREQNKLGKKEAANKGYLNVINEHYEAGAAPKYSDYNARTQFYSEKLVLGYWSIGDERVLTPEGYVEPSGYDIYIKNYNIDGNWHKIASLDKYHKAVSWNYNSGAVAVEDRIAVQNATLQNELFITPGEMCEGAVTTNSPNGVEKNDDGTIKGGFGTTGTDGLMKVLRDYKHYYKVVQTLNNSNISNAPIYGEDDSLVAFRNVTDEELVKATMLILSDATTGLHSGYGAGTSGMKLGTNKTWENVDGKSCLSADDSFKWAQNMASKFFWNITAYQNKWTKENAPCAPSDYGAFLALDNINSGKVAGRREGSSWKWISWHDGGGNADKPGYSNDVDTDLIPIRVTGLGEVAALPSYSAKVWMKVKGEEEKNGNNNAYFKVENVPSTDTSQTLDRSKVTFEKHVVGQDEVLKWSPLYLNSYPDVRKNSEYGWWPTGVAAPQESLEQKTAQGGIGIDYN